MPRIKPFYALRPVVHLQESVVTMPLEHYSLGQARLIASENPNNFLHLVNPELDNQYLRGSRQELVYKKISENLDNFLDHQVLVKDELPSIYVYQVCHNGIVQTGVWTLTHIDDYLKGNIKKHELTVERRERLLADYLQQTGIDANPVLITYPTDQEVKLLIDEYILKAPDVAFKFEEIEHRLWLVNDTEDLNQLINAFESIQTTYIADGHHRMAAMAKMAQNKRKLNSNNGDAGFNYFSSAYFSTDEVQILAFSRLVKDLGTLTETQFFEAISVSFFVEKSELGVVPAEVHVFGMYIGSNWYKLIAKPETVNNADPIAVLDVSILQDHILSPILKITDPRTDARIAFEGGNTPISFLKSEVDSGKYVVAFTLYPTTVQQLIAVADVDGVMPPKSTWVEPKFLVGMLTNHF
ncbi:MAG: DUF1015 domain-containing protein [Pedobacter sp.]|nr:MAG: DUF1015 domain-containing protein [Pedobacter sp.]